MKLACWKRPALTLKVIVARLRMTNTHLSSGWESSRNALVAGDIRRREDWSSRQPAEDNPCHKHYLHYLPTTSSSKTVHQKHPHLPRLAPLFSKYLNGHTSHLRRLHQTAFCETERPKRSQCSTHRARSTLLPHRRATHGHPAETWCADSSEHALPTTHEYSKPSTS